MPLASPADQIIGNEKIQSIFINVGAFNPFEFILDNYHFQFVSKFIFFVLETLLKKKIPLVIKIF